MPTSRYIHNKRTSAILSQYRNGSKTLIPMKRRKFLQFSLPLTFSTQVLDGMAIPIENPEKKKTPHDETLSVSVPHTFRAFIDTLIPEDAISESASTYGVDNAILKFADSHEEYKLLILQGCEWLNAAAKYEGNRSGRFADQSEKTRVNILKVAENTGNGRAGPARFLKTVLSHANSIYYAQPEVWKTLAYDGPPQPNGFADFDRPPRTTS